MHIRPRDETSSTLQQRLFLERLKQYYQSLSLSIVAVLLNTVIIAWGLWTPDNSRTIFVWFGVTIVVSVYRLSTIFRYRYQSDEERERCSSRWYVEMLAGAGLSGLIWGSAGYLLFDLSDVGNQALLAFVIAGMCAGSIVSLSAFVEAAASFLALSLLPFFVRLLVEWTTETNLMAAMVLLYLIMMIAFARRVNITVVDGLEMTYLRSEAEQTIERQALYDELTGLPNRRLLQDRLSQAIARCRRQNSQAALMFLDLDFFKRVNDTLGHSAGDQMLIEVARRMKSLLREEDTAARLGGDEFIALLTDIRGDMEHAVSAIRRRGEELRVAIEQPMDLSGTEVHITVSIGVSLLPADSDNIDDLLKHADTAMYRAKDDGRNTLRFFVADMQKALLRRMEVEKKLRVALDGGQGLQLVLQPQYTDDDKICGAECLLRWECDGEFVSPATFIPVAEDCGLIYRLGDWVIDEACRIGALICAEHDPGAFSLACNVSPRQFRQKDFSDKVLTAIDEHKLPRGLIELELTESLLIDDVDDSVEKMLRLREQGLRFSIDDFGTGYSSLSYLRSLPLDTLKIDQSFVRDVLTDPGDASIVKAIISMAITLDLEVIAEGVETREVHDFLVQAGCPRFQGYLYSRPLPVEEFRALLRTATAHTTARQTLA